MAERSVKWREEWFELIPYLCRLNGIRLIYTVILGQDKSGTALLNKHDALWTQKWEICEYKLIIDHLCSAHAGS